MRREKSLTNFVNSYIINSHKVTTSEEFAKAVCCVVLVTKILNYTIYAFLVQ